MQAPHRAISALTPKDKFLVGLLDTLWERYRSRVEYARRYEELVEKRGATFLNDHVAFRTIALQEPACGVFSVSRLFEALGYRHAGAYEFPDKHLSAIHLQHQNQAFPKVFISQLKSWELSAASRAIIARSLASHRAPLSDAVLTDPSKKRAAAVGLFSELPWDTPQKADVVALNKETQYGAWTLVNGYDVNHFTASVDDIEKTVAAMRRAGIPMKAEIEGEPGSKLRQSATEAVDAEATVMDGRKKVRLPWSYAYFEIAERPWLVAPGTKRKERFEGFLGAQATSLFEMTRRPTS